MLKIHTASSAYLGRTRRGQRGTARAAAGARAVRVRAAALHAARALVRAPVDEFLGREHEREYKPTHSHVRLRRRRARRSLAGWVRAAAREGHGAHGPDLHEIESTPG